MTRRGKAGDKPLGRTQALQKIMARFRPGRPIPSPDLPLASYLELLNAVEPFLEAASAKERQSLFYFLYQGAVRNNRWLAARPPVADPEVDENYNRFVDAFQAVVPADDWNLPSLLLWRTMTRVYRLADSRTLPLSKEDIAELSALRDGLPTLPAAAPAEKHVEYTDVFNKVLAVTDGLIKGEVRTVLSTTVPLLFVLSPYRVELDVRGLSAVATVTPNVRPYGNSIFTMEPAGVNTTPTRWPDGETTVEVVIAGLIDCQWGVEPLQGGGVIPPPVSKWPQGWTVMFEAVDRLYWGLTKTRTDSAVFHPLPSDLLQLDWRVFGLGDLQVEHVMQGSPGSVFKLFAPSNEEKTLDLRGEPEVPWYDRCSTIARAYLLAGETRLGLFWLNVGVEALIDERIRAISEVVGVDLHDILSRSTAYWDEAREVLAGQIPDVVDRVAWPETNQHVSVWRKLKYLHRHYPMEASTEDVMKHYGRVSRHRNALFHGRLHQRLSVAEVEKAESSFKWLHSHLNLRADAD